MCAGARAGLRGSACALSGSRCTLDYLPHPDLEASRAADELQGRIEVHEKERFFYRRHSSTEGKRGPEACRVLEERVKGEPSLGKLGLARAQDLALVGASAR